MPLISNIISSHFSMKSVLLKKINVWGLKRNKASQRNNHLCLHEDPSEKRQPEINEQVN